MLSSLICSYKLAEAFKAETMNSLTKSSFKLLLRDIKIKISQTDSKLFVQSTCIGVYMKLRGDGDFSCGIHLLA